MNVWECDTKLNELIKKPKNEEQEVEDLDLEGDELSRNRKITSNEEEEEQNGDHQMDTDSGISNGTENKVPSIAYKKKSK